MEDRPFEDLIEQSAAGLKVDPEIYLEAKRELRSHLNEKQERFEREGHTPEESTELARKWFCSPMDVAAELLSANRNRMKLRSLVRLAFNAVIVPLVIVAALYVGYGRAARGQAMVSSFNPGMVETRMPTGPFFRVPPTPDIVRVVGSKATAADIRSYYDAHRSDPDAYIFYAHYAANLDSRQVNGEDYVRALRFGESLEPKNALYNMLLTHYYLERGIVAGTDKGRFNGQLGTDDILDREAMDQGIAEWRKATRKPYLRTHLREVVRKALEATAPPVFWEDYPEYRQLSFAGAFRLYPLERDLTRKLPGCARILLSEGHRQEGKRLMDSCRVLPSLILKDSDTIIDGLVVLALETIIARQSSEFYQKLGDKQTAAKLQAAEERLRAVKTRSRSSAPGTYGQLAPQYGSYLSAIMGDIFSNVEVTKEELTPGRMADYAFFQGKVTEVFLAVLVALLIGTTAQGIVWLRRLRRAAAVPLLLLPPTRVLVRAIGLGVVLPIAIYGLYIQLPSISGREYSLAYHQMYLRFGAELGILAITVLSIPALITRRYIRQRCAALAIEIPTPREEAGVGWSFRSSMVAAVALGIGIGLAPGRIVSSDLQGLFITYGIMAGLLVAWIAVERAGRRRKDNGLYYGTMARSMATVYAFTILLIVIIVQPLALRSETSWARKDAVSYGYLADRSVSPASGSLMEARYVQKLRSEIQKALKD